MSYHEGELAVQERAGVRRQAERIGAGIHPSVPPAARDFLAAQTLAVAGWADTDGAMWASLLSGPAGSFTAPDPRTLLITAPVLAGDPLQAALAGGRELGLLVIDLATRRRMRANGSVGAVDSRGFSLELREVYSNCPKYIQAREVAPAPAGGAGPARRLAGLEDAAVAIIERADTFFIASARPGSGADSSHRGGAPGFVRVEDAATLLFPDYAGNTMFNTLGNLAANPRAGLLFIDWASGATLQLSGAAEILWDDPRMASFAGAERLVSFRVGAALLGSAAIGGHLLSYSPFNP
jgi:predicted pyridoxine 5'-phosphate oxidase superfamily flavin-nucleotide-binding protein